MQEATAQTRLTVDDARGALGRAALVLAAGALVSGHGPFEPAPGPISPPLVESVAPPPVAAAAVIPAASQPLPLAVYMNAQPWAYIRVDGRDLGATPLSDELSEGPHQLEAVFPDGRTVRRRIRVSDDSRHFSLR
jgi:hypothetical protein